MLQKEEKYTNDRNKTPDLEQKITELEGKIKERDYRVCTLNNRIARYKADIDEMTNSRSWKITAPLRATSQHSPIAKFRRFLRNCRTFAAFLNEFKFKGPAKIAYVMWKTRSIRNVMIIVHQKLSSLATDYIEWMKLYADLSDNDRKLIIKHIDGFEHKPLISVVMPVYNVEEQYLRRCIDSIIAQLYTNWELCIADDKSPSPHIKTVLDEYVASDSRIKVVYREKNGHISAATNSALELVEGEFIALLDHDDELTEHALYMVANEVNNHPDVDMIYSDEDKISAGGVYYGPYFKTGWNPDLFYAQNMFSHLGVYRTSVIKKIGGFRVGYEGSQDYDLALRSLAQTTHDKVRHIPFVLYHWRAIEGSTALSIDSKNYALEASRKALQSYLDATTEGALAIDGAGPNSLKFGYHRIIWPIPAENPKVSIIIPTKDKLDYLKGCVESICRNREHYENYEILIVDNRSEKAETLKYLEAVQSDDVKVLKYDKAFNYSAINNFAAAQATGDVLIFLNNDTTVISEDWIKEMVMHSLRPDIGAVGAKLLYHNKTVQHNGLLLGIGREGQKVATHAFNLKKEYEPCYYSHNTLSRNVSAVTGACLAVTKEKFEEVGGFDEVNLPISYNDVDICLKLLEKGYRNMVTPYATLYHFESVSRGGDHLDKKKVERLAKETEFMREKWHQVLDDDQYYSPNLDQIAGTYQLSENPKIVKPWEDQ